MSDRLVDGAARLRALDPRESFIVQAPAGSGKTELLTQRYLRLLATVEAPEQIVAITFTRKAAAEMRQRILQALNAARLSPPDSAHKRTTWDLARAVLESDQSHGWQLEQQPSRLRIQTIDAFSASLARRLPVIAGTGAAVDPTDDPSEHTVTELLPERLQKRNLFPCGRLDKYTTGLVLMTNDGELAHRLLAPKTHVEKVYTYVCETALGDEETEKLEAGVYIEGGYRTKPCFVFRDGEYTGRIAITEGKYHQIKQMFSAVGNRIVELRRIRFGSLCLDENLGLGGWRMLRPEEVDALRADAQKN